jgi:hypothetical protein
MSLSECEANCALLRRAGGAAGGLGAAAPPYFPWLFIHFGLITRREIIQRAINLYQNLGI